MTDPAKNTPSSDDLFGDDEAASTTPAVEPKADAKPKTEPNTEPKTKRGPVPVPVTIDNAIEVTYIHWECECGNTNTLDLAKCGKCNAPRFVTE